MNYDFSNDEKSSSDENLIIELSENNDINGLANLLKDNSDSMLCLEAAMALTQLGDKRGLNYLTDALKNPDAKINSRARKILDEMNLSEENLEFLPNQEQAPEQGEVNKSSKKSLICPNCKSSNLFMRAVELQGKMAEVVLKKPEVDLARFLGLDNEYDEIVAFACEDCGYVFFMLKDFM